jgi:hypothetical protein
MASPTNNDTNEKVTSDAVNPAPNVENSENNTSSRESDLEDKKTNVAIHDLTVSLDPDPNDAQNPQNWPKWRKNTVFLALMSSSILCDGGVTWGASLFVAQAIQWDITLAKSSTSINYGLLLNGLGGVFAVPFIESFGR